MAKKGDLARENVKDRIIKAFSETGDYLAFTDKKIYVRERDGESGEYFQFAITMTMPKVPIAADTTEETEIKTEESVEITPADKAKIEELKKMLGIE